MEWTWQKLVGPSKVTDNSTRGKGGGGGADGGGGGKSNRNWEAYWEAGRKIVVNSH